MGKATVDYQGKSVTVEGTPEQIEAAVTQITGFQGSEKPSLGKQVKDSFSGAGIEVARGFQKQGADMIGNIGTLDPTGTLKNISSQIEQSANAMPETNLMPIAKQTYQTIGRTPGMIAEFVGFNEAANAAKIPAALKLAFGDIKATGQMSEAVTLGVQNAINEFRKTNSFSDAVNSFQSGVSTSLGIGVIAEAMPHVIDIGKNMGRGAAKAFLKGITGDEKFAEEFVKNPMKFNLNPFSKVPALKDVEAENISKIKNLETEYNTKISDLKVQNAEKKAALAGELDREYFALRDKNKVLQRSVEDKSKLDVDKISGESSKAFDNTVDLVHSGLLNDFNNTLTKVEAIKETYGKRVGQSVENISSKDPFSRIGMPAYLKRFKEVVERNGYKLQGGKVIPAFGQGTADQETLRMIQNNLDDIKAVAEFSGVPLGFAQKKKELWQKLGYSNQSQAGQVMRQFSGALNPVNLADDIVGNNIANEIGILKKVNSEYSEMIPRYEEAIKNFTKTDASGKPIADFQKVLNAVRKGDKAALKQVAKADSLLPPEDRLLPKAYDASRKLSEAETIKAANVKLAKRKANENLLRLNTDIRQKEFQVKQAQKSKRFDVAQRLQSNLNQMRTVEKTKLEQTISKLNTEQEFVRQQGIARSYTPPSNARRTIQAGGLITAYSNASHNPGLAALTTAGSIGLSPKVATGVIKAGAKASQPAGDILNAVTQLVNSRIGKVMAVRNLGDQGQ